jgi:hypothetical protein
VKALSWKMDINNEMERKETIMVHFTVPLLFQNVNQDRSFSKVNAHGLELQGWIHYLLLLGFGAMWTGW